MADEDSDSRDLRDAMRQAAMEQEIDEFLAWRRARRGVPATSRRRLSRWVEVLLTGTAGAALIGALATGGLQLAENELGEDLGRCGEGLGFIQELEPDELSAFSQEQRDTILGAVTDMIVQTCPQHSAGEANE